MTKKVYTIENLDCANCAAKIESKFNSHPQVEEAVITFATGQLRLTAEDPDSLIGELTQIARSIEPGVVISPRKDVRDGGSTPKTECGCGHHHDHEEGCGCGHHHDHEEGCGCGHHHDHEEGCGCGHHHDHGEECGCGHHHDHGESCGCSHHQKEHTEDHQDGHVHQAKDREVLELALGGGLFVLGLVLRQTGLGWSALLVSLLAYVVLGREVVTTAAKNLVRGHVFDENFLMSVATIGAFIIGEYPEAVGVMLFYRVGEYFEHKAVERSRSQIMEAVEPAP